MHHLALIIDAPLAVDALFGRQRAMNFLEMVHRQRAALWVPDLWLLEVAMLLQWHLEKQHLSPMEAEQILKALYRLPNEVLHIDRELALEAAQKVARLECRTVGDGLYLALAERFGIPFWTSDVQLYDNVVAYYQREWEKGNPGNPGGPEVFIRLVDERFDTLPDLGPLGAHPRMRP